MEYLAKNPDTNRLELVCSFPNESSNTVLSNIYETVQVAEGMVYLHGCEPPVIHSDVKPVRMSAFDTGEIPAQQHIFARLMF